SGEAATIRTLLLAARVARAGLHALLLRDALTALALLVLELRAVTGGLGVGHGRLLGSEVGGVVGIRDGGEHRPERRRSRIGVDHVDARAEPGRDVGALPVGAQAHGVGAAAGRDGAQQR